MISHLIFYLKGINARLKYKLNRQFAEYLMQYLVYICRELTNKGLTKVLPLNWFTNLASMKISYNLRFGKMGHGDDMRKEKTNPNNQSPNFSKISKS